MTGSILNFKPEISIPGFFYFLLFCRFSPYKNNFAKIKKTLKND
jgi:hypothetical protein